MISGYTMVSNAVEMGYCVDACVRSLAEFCDEVVVGYSESHDATLDILKTLESEVQGVRIVDAPADFTVTNAGAKWIHDWTDSVRVQLRGDYQIQLDADEVMAPWSISEIVEAARSGMSLFCRRVNFWGRPDRISPPGVFYSDSVVRCAPSSFKLPSDDLVDANDYPVLNEAVKSNVEILHYNTLRRPSEFLKKSKVMHRILLGEFNKEVEESMQEPVHWSEHYFKNELIEYSGGHPDCIKPWLKEMGYDV